MLPRNLEGTGDRYGLSWEDLTAGAPTIIALARICSNAMTDIESRDVALSDEATAILVAAREKGVIEIRNNHNAFDSVQRFLAVHVETAPDEYLVFKHVEQPEKTVRFIEGFRQLCIAGMVMHQTQHEFSLTARGFDEAGKIDQESVADMLSFASIAGRNQ